MGRQTRLFMAGDDETAFIEFIMSTGEVEILPSKPTTPSERLPGLPPRKKDIVFSKFYFNNRGIPGKIVMQPVEGQDFYHVDVANSTLIEYSRTLPVGGEWRPGRVWAEFQMLDDDTQALVRKSREFELWYDRVVGWVKKKFAKVGTSTYAGPSAAILVKEEGLELVE